MTTNNEPYVLSVETDAGTYQHGFHLGTDMTVAKQFAEQFLRTAEPKIGTYVKTVALKQGGKVQHVYDGEWS